MQAFASWRGFFPIPKKGKYVRSRVNSHLVPCVLGIVINPILGVPRFIYPQYKELPIKNYLHFWDDHPPNIRSLDLRHHMASCQLPSTHQQWHLDGSQSRVTTQSHGDPQHNWTLEPKHPVVNQVVQPWQICWGISLWYGFIYPWKNI